MKFTVYCKGEFLKVKVAEQVLNAIQIKNATAGTVTLNDIRKTL